MGLGLLTRLVLIRTLGADKYHKNLKQKFPTFSTLGVLGVVLVAMALKARDIVSNPMLLLSFLVPLAILYAGNFLISTGVAKLWFNRGDGIALVYGTVMRNLSIALAIAMTSFGREQGSEIALIIAMAYIIQVQAAAWYVRFSDRIFGPVPTTPAPQSPS
jgi:ACR3 family arsenite efflux pump ArsB